MKHIDKALINGSLDLMQYICIDPSDSWSRPVKFQEYQIGKTINLQVSAPNITTAGKVYINTCYATPSSGSTSSLKYAIIDNFGSVS